MGQPPPLTSDLPLLGPPSPQGSGGASSLADTPDELNPLLIACRAPAAPSPHRWPLWGQWGPSPPARHRGEGCWVPQPFLARCHRGVTSPSPLRGQEHQIWGPRPTSGHTKKQEGLRAVQPHRTLRETQFPWVLSHFSSSSSHLAAATHACPCPSREEGAVPGSEGTAVGWHSPPPTMSLKPR